MLYQAKKDNGPGFDFFFETDFYIDVGHSLDIPEMGTGEVLAELNDLEGYRISLSFCEGHKEFYTVKEIWPVRVKPKTI